MLKITNPYTGIVMDAILVHSNYANNGRLYIGLVTLDPQVGYWEPWCDVTVNLECALTDDNCAFVDSNNNAYLCRWIEENHLGSPTGKMCSSGFCVYPEYRFDLKEVEKHASEKTKKTTTANASDTICPFCNNATVNPELFPDNDLSFMDVGVSEKNYGMFIKTGNNEPTILLVQKWDDKRQCNVSIGKYKMKHCPECGRKLTENK